MTEYTGFKLQKTPMVVFIYTAEVDGWFDVEFDGNGANGQKDAIEPALERGETQTTTTNGYGPDRDAAFDLLGTFTPFPSDGFV
jgi:hypothetical protein